MFEHSFTYIVVFDVDVCYVVYMNLVLERTYIQSAVRFVSDRHYLNSPLLNSNLYMTVVFNTQYIPFILPCPNPVLSFFFINKVIIFYIKYSSLLIHLHSD